MVIIVNKKYKKIIIICFVGVCLLLILGVVVSSRNNKKETFDNTYDIIMEKVANKESFLVYITDDDDSKCNNCKFMNKLIKFYHDEYNLDFIYYNNSKNKSGDLEKLNKKFQFQENYLTMPAVILFKDGNVSAVANEMSGGDILKNFLLRDGFISEEYANIEKEVRDNDEFKRIMGSADNKLILVSNGDIKLNRILFESAVKNKFNYYIIYEGKMNYYDQYMALFNLNKNTSSPSLVVINGNKIVDYINSVNEEKIDKFLKKNNIL